LATENLKNDEDRQIRTIYRHRAGDCRGHLSRCHGNVARGTPWAVAMTKWMAADLAVAVVATLTNVTLLNAAPAFVTTRSVAVWMVFLAIATALPPAMALSIDVIATTM
jgi:hypothetical protein